MNFGPPQPRVIQFPDGPQDTVSSLSWSPDGTLIAATAWNKEIKIWQLSGGANQNAVMSMTDQQAPQFTSAFLSNTVLLTAGADNVVKRRDFNSKKEDVVGTVCLRHLIISSFLHLS